MRLGVPRIWVYPVILLVVSIFSLAVFAQRGGDTSPPPEPDYSYLDIFPIGLACSESDTGIGPTWNNLTIGISTIDDFKELFGETEPHYDMLISEIAYIGNLCVRDGVVIAIQVGSPVDMPYLSDYISAYGLPDAVTYGNTPFTRMVFWFEEGIAADIYINPINPEFYEIVAFVIYFPYQEVEGFEERWPYANTLDEGIPAGDLNVSDAQNPFNYDDILATLTVQPPRTPLPTRTLSVTLTPAPTSTVNQ
jgi:hypothetical protein